MNDHEMQRLYAKVLATRSAEGPGTRNQCILPEQLQQIAEGAASQDERVRWMDHIAACPMCMYELALCRATADTAPANALRKPRVTWLALAASVAALAIGTVVWRQNRSFETEVMRGGASPVVLVEPARGAVVSPTGLTLRWRSVPRAIRYDVEILDPSGSPVFITAVADTLATVPSSTSFRPDQEVRWRVTALLSDGTRLNSPAEPFRVQRR